VSNHGLIRFIRFVSRFTVHLCNAIFSIIFNTSCRRFIKILEFWRMDLNTASSRNTSSTWNLPGVEKSPWAGKTQRSHLHGAYDKHPATDATFVFYHGQAKQAVTMLKRFQFWRNQFTKRTKLGDLRLPPTGHRKPPPPYVGGFVGSERSNGSPHSSPYVRGSWNSPIYKVSFNSSYISNHIVSSWY